MHLQQLSLVNYRNHTFTELQFKSSIVALIGNNGIGKTNILDAIYYLCFCKGFINSIDSQNIKEDESFFVVQGQMNHDHQVYDIYCGFKKDHKKVFKLNNKVYEKLSDHIGKFLAVLISPTDINLVLGGSEERRKWLNSIICQYDSLYLQELLDYNHILKQRNALLKTNYIQRDLLEPYNIKLSELGQKIYEKRVAFFEAFTPVFESYYQYITEGKETVSIAYSSDAEQGNLLNQFEEAYAKELAIKTTAIGIHKDDLVFEIKGFPLKKYASQGQQKSYLVALKLSQFFFIKEKTQKTPLLLLDDMFDKLDDQRTSKILTLIQEHQGQVFITDTQQTRLEQLLNKIQVDYQLELL